MENYPIPPEFMAAMKLTYFFGHFFGCLGLVLAFSLSASAGLSPDSLRTEQREGQLCILHQVEQGETLYGLSRRYSVSVQDLQAMNPESANLGVKIGQILVVPMRTKAIVQPAAQASNKAAAADAQVVQNREVSQMSQPIVVAKSNESTLPDVFWHVLEADETLFTLSQRYQIPLQDLLQANPEIEPQQLKAGTRLRIPSRPVSPEMAVSPASPEMAVNPPLTAPVAAPAPSQVAAPSPSQTPDQPSSPAPELRRAQPQASTFPAAVAPPVMEPAHPSARYHTVAAGETLYAIARQYPGTTPALLQSWNGLADNNLRSGQSLIVGWTEPKSSGASVNAGNPHPMNPDQTGMEEAGILTSAAPRNLSDNGTGAEPLVRRTAKARGIATWIDATSPESENGALLALHNDAPMGSWIDVRNLMNNRTVRAKVVGRLPQNLDDSRAIVKLSQGAAKQLQAHDPKVLVEVVYTTAQ